MAMTLLGLTCAGSVVAQDNLPRPRVEASSCADVAWQRDLLAQYPRIAEGCHEVVISNDGKWARFEANLVRANRDGSVTLDFKDRQGRSLEELTLMPRSDLRVSIGGRDYRFAELSRGQSLNVYVPEGMFAVAVEPGAPPAQLAEIVREPVQLAQAPAAQPRAAQADSASAQRLPNTAGPLPLLALAGLMSVLGGLALTIRRHLRS